MLENVRKQAKELTHDHAWDVVLACAVLLRCAMLKRRPDDDVALAALMANAELLLPRLCLMAPKEPCAIEPKQSPFECARWLVQDVLDNRYDGALVWLVAVLRGHGCSVA